MALSGILFDVDGTLIDSVGQHAEAWTRTFAHFGAIVDVADVRTQIGKGGDQLMPVFLPQSLIDQRAEEIEAFRAELFKEEYLPAIGGVAGARPLFEWIRGVNGRIALASSCRADELERYAQIADVAGLYEAAVTSDDAEESKPYPDIFQAALAKLHLSPGAALVVGDSPWDAKAAAAAGIRTLGVLSGGFGEEELRAAGCVEVWRDCADLLENRDRSLLKALER